MKIFCVGMNYREHAQELGSEVPAEPVFFMKPDTALLRNNEPFFIPDFTQDLQYECELVVHINKVFKNVPQRFAHRCYDALTLGIDFTARDLQCTCREKGLPWEIAKAFDKSAAISSQLIPKEELGDVQNLSFELDVNGQTRQVGLTSEMIFSVDYIIAYLSQFFTFKMGDLIYTGTPVGVGKLNIGDHVVARLEGREMMNFKVK